MTPERWRRVQELFHELLTLPPSEQTAALAAASADDADLHRQVAAMLAADAAADQDDAAEAAVARTLGHLETPDLRFGAYRVLETLGRGGMGTVYLAERDDGQFRQRVAVKRIRAELGDDHTTRRMRQERQILATLDHPGIARLLDGGMASDGRPYFVMEYVEGWPLDVYCDDRRLSIGARVELFLSVCAAVHHAHQNLILHRDVKPANVLVTEEGTPKLLDFGIAKLLDSDAPFTRAETAAGLRLLTPEFASPEQLRGEVLGTASDVYSLGVVLYLLLTGEMPYRLPTRRAEWQRLVSEASPPKPSDRVLRSVTADETSALDRARLRGDERPERLARLLRGDLDTIVLTALRQEPERRYASVEQLAEDLRRHLEQLPVRARPESTRYRVGKFVARHRLLVGVTVSLVLSLVAGIISTTWQARRADRALQEVAQALEARGRALEAKDRALEEKDEALQQEQEAKRQLRQTLDFFIETIRTADPAMGAGRDVTVREVVDRLSAAPPDQPIAPTDYARLLSMTGRIYLSLGLPASAEPVLVEALRIDRATLDPSDPLIADSLEYLAEVRHLQGRYDEATALQEEGLAIRLERFGDDDVRVGVSLNDLATLASDQGLWEKADLLFDRSSAALQGSVGDEHPEVARVLANRGVMAWRRGDLDFAIELLTEASTICRQTLSDRHPDTLTVEANLAAVLEAAGRYEAAESLMRDTLRRQIDVYGDDHLEVANTQHNLAVLLARRRQYEEADGLYQQALTSRRRVLGADHPASAMWLRNLGDLRVHQDRHDDAVEPYREALALFRRAPNAERDLAATAVRLAKRIAASRPAEAEALYREVLAMENVEDPQQDVERSTLWLRLGRVVASQGRLDEAADWLRRSLDVRIDRHGIDSLRFAEVAVALAQTLAEQGRTAEARQRLQQALPVLERRLTPDDSPLDEALALQRELEHRHGSSPPGKNTANPAPSPDVELMTTPSGWVEATIP